MSTVVQLNWHSKYQSLLSEITASRLENDRLQAKIDELIAIRHTPIAKVMAERDLFAKKLKIIREALL